MSKPPFPPNASLRGTTTLVAVLGWPVSHSLSPMFQNAALRAAELDAAYVALPVDPARVGEAVRGLRALGFRGANVTIPHKVAVVEHLDRLTDHARLIGAVNTIRVDEDGTLWGHNTDCVGAVGAVEHDGGSVKGRTVAILGAGGAARGCAVGCALAGARRVIVLNRTQSRAEELVAAMKAQKETAAATVWEAAPLGPDAPWDAIEVVMQMTSAGMHGENDLDLSACFSRMPPGGHALEAVYAPLRTRFLCDAESKGLRTSDGLSMLVEQGAVSFEFWFGTKPDRAVMRRALESARS
ncbi:MAG: shikimate dehydrogenase [Candidatus Sumerlaeia bacterium]|nr:shikimate dehydrogenase [Candidatus Sumerlaeia bacterium]